MIPQGFMLFSMLWFSVPDILQYIDIIQLF